MKTITSDLAIRNLKPIKGKRFYEKAVDGEGLRIIVYKTGKKKFEYRYTIERLKSGVLKKVKEHHFIGHYPAVSLSEAREIHRKLVKARRNDIDIKAERNKKKIEDMSHPTLERLTELYYDAKKGSLKNVNEPHSMIKNHILSRIGQIKVKDLSPPVLMDAFQSILKDGKTGYLKKIKKKVKDLDELERVKYDNYYATTTNRCLVQLKAIFAHAVKRGIIVYSPAQTLNRDDAGGEEIPRKRHLSFGEIKILLSKLDDLEMSSPVKLALKVLLLSGKRVGETTLTKKQHLNFKERVWTIPFKNIKATRANKKTQEDDKVYLTDSLILIFKELIEISPSDYVFESTQKAGAHIQKRTIARALGRKIDVLELEKFTPHDLRRTVATGMGEIGVVPHVKEKVLNHAVPGIKGVYDQAEQWDDKVKAWQLWESKIHSICNSEKIISFHSKRKIL